MKLLKDCVFTPLEFGDTPTIEDLQFNANGELNVTETLTGPNSFKVYKLLMGMKKQISSLQLEITSGTGNLYYVVQENTETPILKNSQLAERNFIESHLLSSDVSGEMLYNNHVLKELKGGSISPGTYYILIFYITKFFLRLSSDKLI